MSDFRTGMSGECMSIVYKKTGILPKHIFVNPSDGTGFTKYVPESTALPDSSFVCPKCHEGIIELPFDNYCPNCGVRVEVVE